MISAIQGFVIVVLLWGFMAYLGVKRVNMFMIRREEAMKLKRERQSA